MAFPDVVDLVQGYLAPIVAPTAVVSRVPRTRPDQLVQVRRIGGAARPPVRDQVRLDVICWAATEPDAQALASTVRSAIWALAGKATLGPAIYEVAEFLGPRMDDDALTGTPRVWATYSLTVRADDVIHRSP